MLTVPSVANLISSTVLSTNSREKVSIGLVCIKMSFSLMAVLTSLPISLYRRDAYSIIFFLISSRSICTQSSDEFFRVSCKARDRLRDDAVNLSTSAISEQTVELVTLFHLCACDTFVRIDVYDLVLRILFLILAVVPYLRSEGMHLIGGIA